jgi:hypothetical protein
MKSTKSILRFIISITITIFLVSGCKKNPISPPIQNSSGYLLYVGTYSSNKVFVIDTDRSDSNAVVDSVIGFNHNNITNLSITKGGTKLYVTARDNFEGSPGSLYSVDLITHQMKLILNEPSDAYIAPSGQVFVIQIPLHSSGNIGTIDTLTDEVTFLDTLDIQDIGDNYERIAFDREFPVLYAVNNEARLFAYNYQERKILYTYNNILNIMHMVISDNGKLLYSLSYDHSFLMFDLQKDSIINSAGANHLGSLALSSDERRIYITDPGNGPVGFETPSGAIWVFNTITKTYMNNISVEPVTGYYTSPTAGVALTPDGNTAFVIEYEGVIVVNLQTQKATRFINTGKQVHKLINGIVLGPKLSVK